MTLLPAPATLADSPNNPFATTIPNLQVVWDSTSMKALKRCPRFYYYSILCGYNSRKASIHLTFGILYHEALELYQGQRVLGAKHFEAQYLAFCYALDNSVERVPACQNCGTATVETTCPACQDDVDGSAETWHSLLDRTIEPTKGREQLCRAVIWWTEQYRDDYMGVVTLSNGKPALELSFKLPLDFGPPEEPFVLSGHIDEVAETPEGLWIKDKKTTKSALYASFFEGFAPDTQVSTYTFAGKAILSLPIHGVMIDGVQMGVNFCRYQRGFSQRTEEQLEEWYVNTQHWLYRAWEFANENYWPMNEEACGLYGGCPYRHVCSKSPDIRQKWLDADFITRFWNPAEPR